jgi:hypothetical protein
MIDVLALLERTDKWYLGSGKGTLYAPAFPKFLDTPGFWDETYFADIRLERLFCLLVLDERARPVNLRRALRRWTPDRLLTIYTVEGNPGLRIQEERVVTSQDTLACRLTLTNSGPMPARLHLLLWSLQTCRDLPVEQFVNTATSVEHDSDALSFAHGGHYGQTDAPPGDVYNEEQRQETGEQELNSVSGLLPSALLFVALGGSRLPESWTVNLAEATDTSPLWQTSVFPDKFQNGTLPREMPVRSAEDPNGLLHLALHYVIEAESGSTDALTVGASLALDRETALAQLRDDMTRDVIDDSRHAWEQYFASVPNFTCDDPYLERYYWYRWYGLRLMTVNVQAGQLPYPCVFEGPGAFRSQSAYSTQCISREAAWMHDSSLARGSLQNFLNNQALNNQTRRDGQADDGSLPGHLYLWRHEWRFCPADWGAAALQLFHLTDDRDFVRQMYPGLAAYSEYCDRASDRENIGLYDLDQEQEQDESGQETSGRYQFVETETERPDKVQRKLPLKGVDATCYLYHLQRALTYFARALGNEDAAWWSEKADMTREAVRSLMWDRQSKIFKDVDPQTLKQSPAKAAVGFYPFLSDIATSEHLTALRHLQDPQTFGTPFPVPTISADDPYFDAQAAWQGKRMNRPSNGRVWPLTNSHIMDALSHAARTLDPNLKPLAVDFMQRFVRMMFHDGDPKRPNAYEHYSPNTGMPSLYRGIDDYQQSWILDLILRHVVGVQPAPGPNGALIVDPLPFGLRNFRCEGIPVRGHRIDVIWDRTMGLTVRVDGRLAAESPDMQRLVVPL